MSIAMFMTHITSMHTARTIQEENRILTPTGIDRSSIFTGTIQIFITDTAMLRLTLLGLVQLDETAARLRQSPGD